MKTPGPDQVGRAHPESRYSVLSRPMPARLLPIIFLVALAAPATGAGASGPPEPAPNPDRPAFISSTESRGTALRGDSCQAMRRLARRGNRVRAFLVKNLRTGRVLCGLDSASRLSIASNTKLFTTATALAESGPDYRLATRVFADGKIDKDGTLDGRLYLRGSGDPSLGSARFLKAYFGGGGSDLGRLAKKVRKAGIRRITGRVIGDDSVFDRLRGTAESGYQTSPWVGPLSGLAFNAGYLDASLDSFSRNPAKLATETFTRKLRKRGVSIRRRIAMDKTPRSARSKPVAILRSPDLGWMSRITNVYSNNFFAEMLIKRIGVSTVRSGTTAAGARSVRRWSRRLGAPARILDGSGLSRGNRASPKNILKLLHRVRKKDFGREFIDSLATAGRNGTLIGRMRGTAADGRCQAKTGTLTGVSALSGLCLNRSGRLIGFSVLMNGVTDIRAARIAQDRIAARVAGL